MNSVTKHLTPETIAATLVAMRSGRKDIFLLVEGGTDVALFSQVFALPRSNLVSCYGKENLMALFAMVPTRGLDSGTILIRDRDHDSIASSTNGDVALLVSDLYDIEMHLLEGRLFRRMLAEYLQGKGTIQVIDAAFDFVLRIVARMGALRLYGARNGVPFDFEGLGLSSFIDTKTMGIDVQGMVRKVAARSKTNVDQASIVDFIETTVARANLVQLSCGKDMLDVMHLLLARHFKCSSSSECSPSVLGRTLRISTTLEDLKSMSLYDRMKEAIAATPFHWAGVSL